MLASGVATTAWHLARADGDARRSGAGSLAAAVATGKPPAPRRLAASADAAAVSAPPRSAGDSTGESDGPPSEHRRSAPVAASHPEQAAGPSRSTGRTGAPEAKPYGPWQCEQALQFSAGGNPVLAGACHALGSRVQVRGTLAAPPGGTGTVALSIRDASSGRTMATPRTCAGLVFADRQVTRDCGPASVSLPHGRTYVVVMSWTYTKGAVGARGAQNGATFAW